MTTPYAKLLLQLNILSKLVRGIRFYGHFSGPFYRLSTGGYIASRQISSALLAKIDSIFSISFSGGAGLIK